MIESSMEEVEEKAVTSLVTNAMENTAAHGIGNIRRARTLLRRVIWAILFLFGFSMFVFQGTLLISKYFAFEVDTNFEEALQSRAEFPAVTVCNMNPIKASYLVENDDFLELSSGNPLSDGKASDANGISSWKNESSPTPRAAVTSSNRNYQKYFDWDDIDFLTDTYNGILKAIDAIAQMPLEEVRKTGHEITDMLLACSFNGYPCSPANFTYFYDTMYGNCFTFNGGDSLGNLHTTKVGPLYGLSMDFNVEQEEYEQFIQPAAGIRVTIHPKDVIPFPEDNGVTISPGQETYIGLRQRLVTHLPHPYTNCTPVKNTSPDNLFLQRFPWIVYNRNACEKNCLFYEILHQCNCTDPLYWNSIADVAVCLYSNSDLRECVETVELKYVSGELTRECHCTPACSDTSYETTISAAMWPNKKFMDDVVEIIQNTEELREYYNEDPNFVGNNLARVLVYFNELTYEHVYDTEKYLFSNLLSDIGGQLGLWIGVSVMTVFEFVELMYDIMLVFLRRRKYNQRRGRTGDRNTKADQNSRTSTF